MKTPDKQILAMLKAFNKDDVEKAITLYVDNETAKNELREEGWAPQPIKPEGQEFYEIDGEYWVQTPEMRQEGIDKAVKEMKEQQAKRKYTGQKMNLKKVLVKCPYCESEMYKQSVCPRCIEGKKGYKVRLICEENADHEVLL